MFVKKVAIKNFRIFSDDRVFGVDDINIPDQTNEGSGLTLFVGENGSGKTSLLDAIALPMLSYKADSFSLPDFNNPEEKTHIGVFADQDFEYAGTMPRVKYKGKGFRFEAGVRSRGSRTYLSSLVVSDQLYMRADGETKPEDGKPDLRVSVNNPWSGSRFSENDIVFLDKKRTYQTRSGTYNSTRFDRLMEDFDLQYLKKDDSPIDCNSQLESATSDIDNAFLTSAIEKFEEISGERICLGVMDNWRPFANGFFGVEKPNNQHVKLDNLGSGYEMIFSLLYSFYLANQGEKKLIILIDEPELHLHPRLQEDFVKLVLEFSKTAQIILTSHSPLLVKQVLRNQNARVNILRVENGEPEVGSISDMVLPYVSANEINYVAFGLSTEEYHNELFEELYENYKEESDNENLNIKDFDLHFFQQTHGESPDHPYKQNENQVSIHTHLRTQIHHRGTVGAADSAQIQESVEKMRSFFPQQASEPLDLPL